MRSLTLISVGALASLASAISLVERRDGAEPRVVQLDTQRRTIRDPRLHDRNRMSRRDGTVEVTLDNQMALYSLNISLGTPPQLIQLDIDTGSSDAWVIAESADICSQSSPPCTLSGTYDANASSTYEYVNGFFNISYVDGSGAYGDYVRDNAKIGGKTVKDLQFGVGYETTSDVGVLGVGYTLNEAVLRSTRKTYPNLPAKMVDDGLINSNAYSLYLNDRDASTGTILFGGVDRSQYEGDLVTLPIERYADVVAEFFVTLTGMEIGSNSFGSMALAVLLDSGTFLTYLPDRMVSDIYEQLDASYDQRSGAAYVPCSLAKDSKNDMEFEFGGAIKIKVPIDEMVIDEGSGGQQPLFDDGTPACLLGIAPAGSGTNLFGDTFLRSAYVVYDLENNEISMAQSNFDASDSDIVEISKSSGAPSATPASDPVVAQSGLPENGAGGGGLGDIDGSHGGEDGDSGEDDGAGMLSPRVSVALLVGAAALLLGQADLF